MVPTKRDARIAGWLYFLFAAPGPFCLMYVPHKIMVPGDAAATAANLLAHEMLLRTSVVIWLLGLALWIVMAPGALSLIQRSQQGARVVAGDLRCHIGRNWIFQ